MQLFFHALSGTLFTIGIAVIDLSVGLLAGAIYFHLLTKNLEVVSYKELFQQLKIQNNELAQMLIDEEFGDDEYDVFKPSKN